MSERIMVTGGTGFIGYHAVVYLVSRGHDVIVAASREPAEKIDGAHYVLCDLTDQAQIERLCTSAKASSLLHIAWRSAVSGLWGAPENADWLMASLNLAQTFLKNGGKRITLCGTCGEYDWRSGLCEEDTTALRPSTVYGTAKVAMLHGVRAMCEIAGAEFACGRPFFVYGPREHESRLAASVIRSLLKGEEAFCSHGMQLRDYAHAADVGRGLASLALSPLTGEYNLGTGEAIRVKDLIMTVAELIGRPHLVRLGARQAPAFEPPLIVADMTKTRASELDWAPQFTLEAGLANSIEWYRARM